MSDTHFDYVTVGHVTRDAIEHTKHETLYRVGGSAFYSALQAARLGMRTLILTQGVPSEIEELLAPYRQELELRVIPAAHTTTLSVRGAGTKRTQRLLAWAGPMVEAISVDTGILHLAPVARETPVSWEGEAGFVGVTPQGLVRRWREEEGIPFVPLQAGPLGDSPLLAADEEDLPGDISAVALDPAQLPDRFDAAVIAEHERSSCHALFTAARRCGANVAVTAGPRRTTVHLHGAGAVGQGAVGQGGVGQGPDIDRLDIDRPAIDGPDIDRPDIDGPDIDGPDTDRPDTDRPGIDRPDIDRPVVGGSLAEASVVQTPLPPTVAMCDDIGAGDVFAAAFFVALAENRAPLQAAVFANAAAAIRIAGEGPDAIASREQIIP
ncbi:MAG TPA: PfkB family carbohydrate kinase [Solirubrobacteraceae bacterium]|nr:PfkB family carbohydrate kinase [Solirubrobacteraceae bacterium]